MTRPPQEQGGAANPLVWVALWLMALGLLAGCQQVIPPPAPPTVQPRA